MDPNSPEAHLNVQLIDSDEMFAGQQQKFRGKRLSEILGNTDFTAAIQPPVEDLEESEDEAVPSLFSRAMERHEKAEIVHSFTGPDAEDIEFNFENSPEISSFPSYADHPDDDVSLSASTPSSLSDNSAPVHVQNGMFCPLCCVMCCVWALI